MSLFHRAAAAGSSSNPGASEGDQDGNNDGDPLSLCDLAQLLLAPYHHRRRPRQLLSASSSSLPPVDRKGKAGHNCGGGGGGGGCTAAVAADRPETDFLHSPLPPTASKTAAAPVPATATAVLPTGGPASTAAEEEEEAFTLTFPTDEDKNEAARLLARAFSSAGGEIPPESVYFGEPSDDGDGGIPVGESGDIGAADRGGRSRHQDRVLADVHLVVSGFSLKRGRGGGGSGGAVDTDGGRSGAGERQRDGGSDGANEWHLREAARISPPDTKTGITAR